MKKGKYPIANDNRTNDYSGMANDNTRQALSDFLRSRRARLSPRDAGLPGSNGRRVQGLRREEVAVLAGVSLTWYTWLEQGRTIQVSDTFLDQVAGALQLNDVERMHLYALAQGHLPLLSHPDHNEDEYVKIQAILDAFDSPAYARNARFDVIAWNAANTAIFGDFEAIPAQERNVVRLMFSKRFYRRTMLNWEHDARSLVAKLRLNFGQASGIEAFENTIRELNEASGEFARIWATHDVSDAGEGVTLFLSSRLGKLQFQHHTLMPEGFPNLRIVVFIPVQSDAMIADDLATDK